ncbi:alkanesulfonate monooxygenase SsuD/methylene tetrahydromethanopterin reductase-like flavin-dependent oxidoreductase (luciferase family) [Microbacterium terrae]|uniref:LLM class flavin-dependent oxidoreductase n=1 Tax=Microbacterium terrae TaxID=69369 RepID=UPI000697DAB4|nr:LLM class flavin-dependent oxidoreductase [Microbacterium terrae]MBP1078419.1 alkanesulfonate monooxygenase SsuD/methylene tetrahydromethanopterin reductase-like flavin-dependent oxidoreductase (luciferase family) [Microbacterium terrae]GLJ99319.1 monooxygenase [Microbacterium terrae]
MTVPRLLIIEAPSSAVSDPATADDVLAALRAITDTAASFDGVVVGLPEIAVDAAAAIDPAVAAGLLSAGGPRSFVVSADTGRHAPFNLARRVQTLARITGGRIGLHVRSTGIDPLTRASGTVPATADPIEAFAEYLAVLSRLWRSFPDDALVGDRDSGILADPSQLAPADFTGRVYAVAGALNVPLDPALRPVVIVDRADAVALARRDVESEAAPFDAVLTDVDDELADEFGVAVLKRLVWSPASATATDAAQLIGAVDADGVVLRIDAPLAQVAGALEDLLAATGREPADDDDAPLRALREVAVR